MPRESTPSRRGFPASLARHLAALALGTAPWAAAQATPGVLTPVDTPPTAGAAASVRLGAPAPGAVRRQAVLVDVDALASGRAGDLFALDLFPDIGIKARIERSARTASGRYLQGRSSGEGDVSLVVRGAVAVGKIQAGGRSYSLRPALPASAAAGAGGRPGRRLHIVERLDPTALPPPAAPLPMPDGMAARAERAASAPRGRGAAIGDTAIDVMVVYEARDAAAYYGGEDGVAALIELLVAETNLALEHSGVAARIRLAHRQAVDYQPSVRMGEDLDRLQDPGDGHLDEVHMLRDLYAADLVHLLVGRAADSCGVAYLLTADVPEAERYGFSVSAAACHGYGYAFAHELGHNMGLHHDRYVAGRNRNVLYRYAYGYVNQAGLRPGASVVRRWRTIMAYGDQCRANGVSCRILRRFSNPDRSYGDDPLGVERQAEDRERDGGPADARRVINRTLPRLAGFRSRDCRPPEIVPSSRYVPLAGGRAVFLVRTTAGCAWQAEAALPWLAVGAATGSGTRVLAVDVSAAAAEREGALFVSGGKAGRSALVRQVAELPVGGVCRRSPLVRDAIVAAAGFAVDGRNCARVTTAHLAAIGHLDLSGLGILALAPGDLTGLIGLRELDLADNRLITLPAKPFADLRKLERLDLRGNGLRQLSPDVLAGLGRLTTLDLSHNDLAALPEGVFADLSGLATLRLASNGIESLPAGVFSGHDGLSSLDLARNGLAALPAGLFRDLRRLVELKLNNNRLRSLDADTFQGLTMLGDLSLKRNLLAEIPGGLFAGLANLRRLRLYRNYLSGLPAGALAGLGKLEQLSLYDNRGVELPVSIVRDGALLRASIPVGAPFPLALLLRGENVILADDAGRSVRSVAIPTGSTESAPFTATRPAGAVGPSAVDLGPLPALPTSVDGRGARKHYGYTLAKRRLPLLLTPGLVVSAERLRLGEGSVASYTVRLSTRPNGPVRVTVRSDNADVTLATGEDAPRSSIDLAFDPDAPARWDLPQTVRVHAAVDADRQGDTARLRHELHGYAGSSPTVDVTVAEWPHVLSAFIEAPPRQFGTFGFGETISVAVVLAVPAAVAGEPRLALHIGPRTRMANYHSCSDGCRRLSFRYVVQGTDQAPRYVAAGVDAVDLGDGAISDMAGRPLDMRLPAAIHAAYRVDGSGERTAKATVVRVVGASAPVDGRTFRRGEEVRILVRFDRPVTVTGEPALRLMVGRQARLAVYSRHASRLHCLGARAQPPWPQCDSLVFVYIVAPDDFDDDGIAVAASALLANGGAIAGTDAPARLDIRDATFEVADGLRVDGGSEPPPAVIDAIVQSKPRNDDAYGAGESIDILIAFSDAVSVVGTPRLALAVGPRTVYSEQVACGRYAADRPLSCRFLGFRHIVQSVDVDADGISIDEDALTSGGALALGADGRRALLGLGSHSIADARDHRVNGRLDTPPRVAALDILSTPLAAPDTYGAGERIVVGVAFDEPVAVAGTPQLQLTIGARTRLAAYLAADSAEWPAPAWPAAGAVSAEPLLWTQLKASDEGGAAPASKARRAATSERLAFAYLVQAADADPDGMGVAADALALNGGVIRDGSGQAAVPDLAALSFSVAGSHKVDGSLTANRPPFVLMEVDALALRPGDAMRLDAARHFEDPDGDTLAYAARSSNGGVASVAVVGGAVDVVAQAPGATVVVLTAADAHAAAVETAFPVTVADPLGAASRGALPPLELVAGATAGVVLDALRRVGDQRFAYRATSTNPEVATAEIVDGLLHVVAVAPGLALVGVADAAGYVSGWSLVTVRAGGSVEVDDLAVAAGGIAEIDLGGGLAGYSAASSRPAVATVAIDGRGRLRVDAKAPGRATVTLTAASRDGSGMGAVDFLATVSEAPAVPPLDAGGETRSVALESLFPSASADTSLACGTGDRRTVTAEWRDGHLVLRPGEHGGRTDVVAAALFANGWRASVRLPVSVAPTPRPGLRGWRLALPRLVGEAAR